MSFAYLSGWSQANGARGAFDFNDAGMMGIAPLESVMANEDQDLELDLEEEVVGNSGGLSKKMLMIIGFAVLLIGGGLAAFLLLTGDDTPEVITEGEGTTEIVEVKEKAQYVGVPEAITANLQGKKRNRTVQIKMSFMVRGDDAVEAVKTHMPRLKNDVLMLVSLQSADRVAEPEGRRELKQKSLATVQATMTNLVGEPTIDEVLFISFVMQ